MIAVVGTSLTAIQQLLQPLHVLSLPFHLIENAGLCSSKIQLNPPASQEPYPHLQGPELERFTSPCCPYQYVENALETKSQG